MPIIFKDYLESTPKALIRDTIVEMIRKSRDTGVEVGYCLAHYLRDEHRIEYKTGDTCRCNLVLRAMNRAGPDEIEANLDYWVDEVFESAKLWYRKRVLDWVGLGRIIPNPCLDAKADDPDCEPLTDAELAYIRGETETVAA